MKSPSTGNPDPSGEDRAVETGKDHGRRTSQTRTSVNGEKSPRLPHERDESSDTAIEPDPVMRIAHDDAESGKRPGDRSEETDAAYSKLRGKMPGKERDINRS